MEYERINTVQLHGLTLGYRDRVLFTDAGIGFGWGEFTALIGRNGTGKSTLLRTIAGLSRPLAGHITVNGRRTDEMSRREIAATIAFVSTEEVKVENLKVSDVVALGRAPYTNWVGSLTENDRAKVTHALALVGMQEFSAKGIDTLSDGERQRVMIARASRRTPPSSCSTNRPHSSTCPTNTNSAYSCAASPTMKENASSSRRTTWPSHWNCATQ